MQRPGIAGDQNMETVDQRQQALQPRFTDLVIHAGLRLRADQAHKLFGLAVIERCANQHDTHIWVLRHQLIGQPRIVRNRPATRLC